MATDAGDPYADSGPADHAVGDALDTGVESDGSDASRPIDAGIEAEASVEAGKPTFLVGVLDSSSLVRLDVATGATTTIGTLSLNSVFMTAFEPQSGTLYGVREDFVGLNDLVTIDPCTATVTKVATFTAASGTLQFIEGFAVDPSTGTIYATGSTIHALPESTSDSIFTVNPTSAVLTKIATGGTASGDTDNLVFAAGTTYATDVEGFASDETFLYTMVPTTGAVTEVGTKSSPTQIVQIAIEPASGQAYASDLKPTPHLSTVDLSTNVYTKIADVAGLGSIAFVSAECP